MRNSFKKQETTQISPRIYIFKTKDILFVAFNFLRTMERKCEISGFANKACFIVFI